MLIASVIGEIVAAMLGFAFLLWLSTVVPSARRRNPWRVPEKEDHDGSAMTGRSLPWHLGMFTATCDICGKNAISHFVKLRLKRSDFNVFNTTIYKRTIAVGVCDECQKSMDAVSSCAFHFGMVVLFVGTIIGCCSIYLLFLFIGVQRNLLQGVIVLGGSFGVLIAIVAYWIFKSTRSVVSYMDTWQMKDLSKDDWCVIGVEK